MQQKGYGVLRLKSMILSSSFTLVLPNGTTSFIPAVTDGEVDFCLLRYALAVR